MTSKIRIGRRPAGGRFWKTQSSRRPIMKKWFFFNFSKKYFFQCVLWSNKLKKCLFQIICDLWPPGFIRKWLFGLPVSFEKSAKHKSKKGCSCRTRNSAVKTAAEPWIHKNAVQRGENSFSGYSRSRDMILRVKHHIFHPFKKVNV